MKPLALDDEIPFGKYEGEQIEDLIEDRPDYIRFLIENCDTQFDDEALENLERREQRR